MLIGCWVKFISLLEDERTRLALNLIQWPRCIGTQQRHRGAFNLIALWKWHSDQVSLSQSVAFYDGHRKGGGGMITGFKPSLFKQEFVTRYPNSLFTLLSACKYLAAICTVFLYELINID